MIELILAAGLFFIVPAAVYLGLRIDWVAETRQRWILEDAEDGIEYEEWRMYRIDDNTMIYRYFWIWDERKFIPLMRDVGVGI